jgi:hypothetical protein
MRPELMLIVCLVGLLLLLLHRYGCMNGGAVFGQDECWVFGVIAICTGVWEFTDCYFCTWMLVCTILSTTVFEPVCPIVFTDRFRICDLPILCTTILHLPMWWTVCMLYVVSYWCDAAIAQIQTNFSPGRHNKLTWLDYVASESEMGPVIGLSGAVGCQRSGGLPGAPE